MGRRVDRRHVIDRLTKCWSIYQLTYRSRFRQYINRYVDRVSVNINQSLCQTRGEQITQDPN